MHVAIRVFFARKALLVGDGRALAILFPENLATTNRFLTLRRCRSRLAHFEIAGACGCLQFVAIVLLKAKALVEWLLSGWVRDLANLRSYLIARGRLCLGRRVVEKSDRPQPIVLLIPGASGLLWVES